MKSICNIYKDDVWIALLNIIEKRYKEEVNSIVDYGIRDIISMSFWHAVWIKVSSK